MAAPVWIRGLALVLAMMIVCAVEFTVRGGEARRYKEYAAWLAFALCGAAFGALNDWNTSAISPAYFELGKGLPPGPRLPWAAADLGAQAGAWVGLGVGGVLLLANNPRRNCAPLPYRKLAQVALLPVLLAGGCALLLALGTTFDLQGLGPELTQLLAEKEITAFLRVQRAHLGAYAGAMIGTPLGVFVLKRWRDVAGSGPCLAVEARRSAAARTFRPSGEFADRRIMSRLGLVQTIRSRPGDQGRPVLLDLRKKKNSQT